MAIADYLGRAQHTQVIEPMISLLADENALPRQQAAKALKTITGQDLGEDVEKWRTWWRE